MDDCKLLSLFNSWETKGGGGGGARKKKEFAYSKNAKYLTLISFSGKYKINSYT